MQLLSGLLEPRWVAGKGSSRFTGRGGASGPVRGSVPERLLLWLSEQISWLEIDLTV
jgi:hypothetical protein